MRNEKKLYAISVESRKGGVGKTTIALNLARLLLKSEQYEVVFLDLDISGTESAKIVPALERKGLWKNNLYAVNDPYDEKEKLNLVNTFESYMTGKDIPSVTWDIAKGSQFNFKSGKINILSSFLRRVTHKERRDLKSKKVNNNHKTPVYSPDALFDENHSTWFMTMIQELLSKAMDGLSRRARSPKRNKLAVVIDNAPGYSGFEPVIEEWLTTIGPECGKILFVSSTDGQDIYSCFQSIRDVHEVYCEKWQTSRAFKELSSQMTYEPAEKIYISNERFLNRLAESAPWKNKSYKNCAYPAPQKKSHPNCTNCGLCFFLDMNEDHGAIYMNDAAKYIAIIINKTPRLISNKTYSLAIGDLLQPFGFKAGKEITIGNISTLFDPKGQAHLNRFAGIVRNLPRYIVPFNEGISYQFVADRMDDSEVRTGKKQITKLSSKKKIKAMQSLEKYKDTFRPQYLFAGKDWGQKIVDILGFDFRIRNSIQVIRPADREGVHTIYKFWEPEYSLFFQVVRSGINIKSLFSRDYTRKRSEAIGSAEEYAHNFMTAAQDDKEQSGKEISLSIAKDALRIRNFASSATLAIAKDVEREIQRKLNNVSPPPIWVSMEIALDVALDLAAANIRNKEEARKIIIGFTSHLITFLTLNNDKLDERVGKRDFWIKQIDDSSHSLQNLGTFKYKKFVRSPESFLEVFQEFCLTRARVIDAKEDFDFLIDCFKTIVFKGKRLFHSDAVKKVAQAVIVEKRKSHKVGLESLIDLGMPKDVLNITQVDDLEEYLKKDELKDFDDVLNVMKSYWKI
jgi:hypothetical protein